MRGVLRRFALAGTVLAGVLVLSSTSTAQQTSTTEERTETFRSLDRNGDGVISRSEWNGSEDSFLMLDLNGDGVLSPEEFLQGKGTGPRATGTSGSYSLVDLDGDGRVNADEWMRAFNKLDVNHDGVLTEDEFPINCSSASTVDRTTRSFQAGHERGLADGREAGREDKQRRNRWDLEGQRELVQADAGYTADLGRRAEYQAGYREGFRQGYREGFGPRS